MGDLDFLDDPVPARKPVGITAAKGQPDDDLSFLDDPAPVKPPEPNFLERAANRVGDSFSRLGHTVARAVPAAIDLVSPISKTGELQVPFGQLANPSYRHELERGISDTVTGGLAEKAANAADPSFAKAAPAEAASAPGVREMGSMAGLALPSPFTVTGKAAARVSPRFLKPIAAYEGMAVPQAATQAAINADSGNRLEAAKDAALDAATDPAGLALAATPLAAKGAAKVGQGAVERFAKGAEERQTDRAIDRTLEGGVKRTRGRLEAADEKLRAVYQENAAVKAAAMKGDAALADVAETIGQRGRERLAEIYDEANASKPSAPKEIELGDQDVIEALPAKLSPLVPQPASRLTAEKAFLSDAKVQPAGGGGFDEITNAGHATVGGETVAGPGRPATADEIPQVREVSSRPLGDKFPEVRKYVPGENFQSVEFENIQDPSKTVIVHGSTKTPGKWQTSHFDAEGPSGDRQSGSPAEALRDLHPSQWKPKTPDAAATSVPVSIGESESLFASAKAAEVEAAKLTARAERAGRQADGFVNKELSEKAARRASGYEIRADEARQQAEAFRQQAEAIKARDSLPSAEAPAIEPATVEAPPPAEPQSGARPADAISNFDRSINRLSKGNTDEIAVANQLKKLRDTFAESSRGGAETIPVQLLREQQSVWQKHGYGKAIKGQAGYAEASAQIEAARQASKDIGDIVVKQVTGMDYPAAKAAAKADPNSLAGKLFKANRDVEIANLIQAHLDSKTGQNPSWARNILNLAKVTAHATGAGLAGLAAHHLGPEAAAIVAGAQGAIAAAPYAARAIDEGALRTAPAIRRFADSGRPANPAAVARLIQAARAGATRAQIQAQARQDGVPDEIASNISASSAQ